MTAGGRTLTLTIAALLLTNCGGGGEPDPPATSTSDQTAVEAPTAHVRGTAYTTSLPCRMAGSGGDAWKVGDPVVILNGSGKELAVGKLTREIDRIDGCGMEWEVDDVPEGEEGYAVKIDTDAPVTMTWSELLDEPDLGKN